MLGLSDVAAVVSVATLAIDRQVLLAGVLLGSGMLVVAIPGAVRLARSRGWRLPRSPARSGASGAGVEDRLKAAGARSAERRHREQLSHEVRDLTKLCIREIDERSAQLEALIERAERAASRLEGAGELDRARAPEIGVRRIEPKTDVPAPAGAVEDPLRGRILGLAREGKSPLEIAEELDEHVGKVELILALGR